MWNYSDQKHDGRGVLYGQHNLMQKRWTGYYNSGTSPVDGTNGRATNMWSYSWPTKGDVNNPNTWATQQALNKAAVEQDRLDAIADAKAEAAAAAAKKLHGDHQMTDGQTVWRP